MKRTLDRATVLQHFLTQLDHFRKVKEVQLSGHGLAFSALYRGKPVRGVALVRSGDYWDYRLHLPGKKRLPPSLIVCYQHDSIVPCRVLALEDGKDYAPEDLPGKYASLDAVKTERSRHAARVLLGGLLCGKKAAHDILSKMDESTQRKYEARMHGYQRRPPGRPVIS